MSTKKNIKFNCTTIKIIKNTKKAPIKISINDIKANIKKLFECYYKGYEPPKWSKTPNLKLMEQCRVFYHPYKPIFRIR